MSSIFVFPSKYFTLIWNAARYFSAFIFFDAFLWKLFRGSLFAPFQGELILKRNFISLLFYEPASLIADMYNWVLKYPSFIDILFKAGILMESVFLIAFFTKKFDKVLFVIVFLLPFGFLFFAEAYFFEYWILCFLYLPLSALDKLPLIHLRFDPKYLKRSNYYFLRSIKKKS